MDKREASYHIQCRAGDIGRYCILPGDPGRCGFIAGFLDAPEMIASHREYVSFSGSLLSEKVSVVSTGIGGPSAVIALEELFTLGARVFIRVGTCGGISTNVRAGDLIAASAAVRQEGTSLHYAPPEFPASADFEITSALLEAARALGARAHCGVVQSKDSFYGQHDPARMPVSGELAFKWEAWKRLGVLGSEMEAAALFVASHALGARCGAVLNVIWNQEREALGLHEPESPDMTLAVRCAVEAVKLLIMRERAERDA